MTQGGNSLWSIGMDRKQSPRFGDRGLYVRGRRSDEANITGD